MPFNIACAGIILQEYTSSHDKSISYPSYCLAITELALMCLMIVSMIHQTLIVRNKLILNLPIRISLILGIYIWNIVYSVFIIQDYKNHTSLNQSLFAMSIAVIVTNGLYLLGFCGFWIGINNTSINL